MFDKPKQLKTYIFYVILKLEAHEEHIFRENADITRGENKHPDLYSVTMKSNFFIGIDPSLTKGKLFFKVLWRSRQTLKIVKYQKNQKCIDQLKNWFITCILEYIILL